jgi:putative FmdB family regulatory protein
MPTYRYRCEKCGDEPEVWQSFDEKPLTRHKGECKGKLVRVLTPAGIVLKGSGFYKTDNRSNGKHSDGAGKDKERSKESTSSSTSSQGDTKSDTPKKAESTSSASSTSSSSGKDN